MSETGEDDLVQLVRLRLDRRDDPRMAVTVGHHPPRRDGVEDPASIGRLEPGPLPAHNGRHLAEHGMLGEGMPDR
jgi:hypothetical protein